MEVGDRRVREQLVDAIAASKRARIHEVRDALSRSRLKEICLDLDLDDGDREKAVIIERRSALLARPGQLRLPNRGEATYQMKRL